MVAVPHMMIDIRRKGIKDYNKVIPALRRNLMITLKVFGNAAAAMMSKKIKSGGYDANSPPWKAAKGGGKVLYDTGYMSTKIKNRLIPSAGPIFASVEIGFLSDESHPRQSNGNIQDIAKFLTGKQTWKPSQDSIKAFWAKVPKGWKSSNPPMFKDRWTSPARDFIKDTAYDPAMIALLHKHVDHAIKRTLKGK